MLDEPFPIDLIWVSRRRTREIVELYEARRPLLRVTGGKLATPSIPPYIPSAEVSFERASARTLPDYAVRATECVRHETGSLQQPDRFIRMTLNYAHVATWALPFAWPDGSQQRVSTLFTTEFVQGIGRVFVALFGSPHNILADMEPELYHTGRVPSAAYGLYRIIDAMREPDEMQLVPKTLTDDLYRNDVEAESRAEFAAGVIYGLSDPLPAQRLEILAEPTSIAYNHTVGYSQEGDGRPRSFEMTVVGSAIWAGTPASKPNLPSWADTHDESPRMWPLLDDNLYESLDGWRRGVTLNIPAICLDDDERRWRAYASWFVNLGRNMGQREYDLYAYTRRPKWSPARYLGSQNRFELHLPTGMSGFLLRPEVERGAWARNTAVLVTGEGDAIAVLVDERTTSATYWPGHRQEWIEPNELPRSVEGNDLTEARRGMWVQAAEWIRRAH